MVGLESVTTSSVLPLRVDVESLLVEVSDVLNTTLELDTLLQRVAEVVKRVIDYEIFSILLLNERTQELRFRFQIGHAPDVAERFRVKVGHSRERRDQGVLIHRSRGPCAFRVGGPADHKKSGHWRNRY
jgi:transcriptional regulator with GAF, ATPase, and Fis domain